MLRACWLRAQVCFQRQLCLLARARCCCLLSRPSPLQVRTEYVRLNYLYFLGAVGGAITVAKLAYALGMLAFSAWAGDESDGGSGGGRREMEVERGRGLDGYV